MTSDDHKIQQTRARVNMERISILRKDPEFRRKVIHTVLLCLSFFTLGVGGGIRGPALMDLQLITDSDVQEASAFFTAGAIGLVTGSLIAGVVYDLMSKLLLLVLCLVAVAASTAATPFCTNYWLMVAVNFMGGSFQGAISTVCNADVVRTWSGKDDGKRQDTAMQALHFTFALGSLLAPLIVQPFLAPSHGLNDLSHNCTTNNSLVNSTSYTFNDEFFDKRTLFDEDLANYSAINQTNGCENTTDSQDGINIETRVHYAFIICALLSLLPAIPLSIDLACQKRRAETEGKVTKIENAHAKTDRSELPRVTYALSLMWLCLFYLVYIGVEYAFPSFLSYFVAHQVDWSSSQGALLTSVYWILFAAGRLVMILLVMVLSHVQIISGCFALLLISLVGVLLSALQELDWALWVGTALCGAAMAAVCPVCLSWVNAELLPLTGRATSAVMLAMCLACVINPLIVGYLMKQHGAISFAYMMLGQTMLAAFILAALLLFTRLFLRKKYKLVSVRSRAEPVSAETEQDQSHCAADSLLKHQVSNEKNGVSRNDTSV